jgi:hypothetical protein
MQSSVACAWLLVCIAFHGALDDVGANAEGTILQALMLAYLGFNMPRLTQMQRTLYIEFVRTAVLFNVVGDQLCRPFGGGKTRIQAHQLVGIRAAHVGGLALNNLRAMLEAGNARATIRRRSPSTFVEFMEPTMYQDNLEIGFCVLWGRRLQARPVPVHRLDWPERPERELQVRLHHKLRPGPPRQAAGHVRRARAADGTRVQQRRQRESREPRYGGLPAEDAKHRSQDRNRKG